MTIDIPIFLIEKMQSEVHKIQNTEEIHNPFCALTGC
jgi:hypothetical protein